MVKLFIFYFYRLTCPSFHQRKNGGLCLDFYGCIALLLILLYLDALFLILVQLTSFLSIEWSMHECMPNTKATRPCMQRWC